jgi:hypothetical protein
VGSYREHWEWLLDGRLTGPQRRQWQRLFV